ncbi:nucleosidase [Skermania piniformis]|uniref:nucleosidase n=1 Tax=Skermania pinensis TaxID=39122 RepID=UPI00083632C6|nr:nucleosidase [Skermania piniformis]
MTDNLLVVAATRAEAADVPTGLPLVITGIGKTAAAVAVATALARVPDPSRMHVVNIGTAGALRDGVTGLHRIGSVWNHDLNAAAIRTLGYDPQERLHLGAGPALASGDLFVTEPAARTRLAEVADLVDMEGYAVAFAARRFGAPVTLVKHVSDNADAAAFDWPAAVAGSARVLGEWLAGFSAR